MRVLISFLLLVSIVFQLKAQRDVDDDASWSFRDRAYTGLGLGGLGLGQSAFLGRYFTVGVSAQQGYMITKGLSSGVGFEYQYTNFSDLRVTQQQYGVYPFIRQNVFRQFFVQADYNWFWISATERANVAKGGPFERFFLGAGYSTQAGRRGYMNFLISYDFLYTNTSIFGSPISTRLFFTF